MSIHGGDTRENAVNSADRREALVVAMQKNRLTPNKKSLIYISPFCLYILYQINIFTYRALVSYFYKWMSVRESMIIHNLKIKL